MAEENSEETTTTEDATPAEESNSPENQPSSPQGAGTENLRVLENIDVALTVEVGGAEIKIRELLRLGEGSVVELDRLAGDPLDILANGTMIAKGEVVMVGERFGVRFTEVTSPEDTVKKL